VWANVVIRRVTELMAGQQTPKRVGEISFLWTLCFVNLFRVDFALCNAADCFHSKNRWKGTIKKA